MAAPDGVDRSSPAYCLAMGPLCDGAPKPIECTVRDSIDMIMQGRANDPTGTEVTVTVPQMMG